MGITFKYKPPDTDTGSMRTQAVFYEYGPAEGPDPIEVEKEILFKCFAEVYNPSMKDIEIMKTTGTKEAVTIRVRDTKGEYTPTNKHRVKLLDYRYEGKLFNIVDVRYDFTNNNFVTMLLGCTS